MKKSETLPTNGLVDIPPFDFEHSQPNPYADQYEKHAETVIFQAEQERSVILEPDVAAYFPDSASVNAALRAIISAISHIKHPTPSP
jgi:hypothetical protein